MYRDTTTRCAGRGAHAEARWAVGRGGRRRGTQSERARRAVGAGRARSRSARGMQVGRAGGTLGARRLGTRGAGGRRAACACLGVLLGQ